MKTKETDSGISKVAAWFWPFSVLGILWAATPAHGQAVLPSGQACPQERVEATLGISGLDCVGECVVNVSEAGRAQGWSFSAEPRILQIEAGGPADGVLRRGDFLVAVDGLLITTREGGRRFATLEPESQVRISYRREGVVREALLRTGAYCAEPPRIPVLGRVPPPRPDQPEPAIGIATAPKIRVAPPAVPDTAVIPRLGGSLGLVFGGRREAEPRGRLGLGFQCTECGTAADEETGREIWFFSGPVEVTQVNAGGAAEEAGIRLGDFITAVDGKDLTTRAGGEAFSSLVPGEAVELTLTRRDGRVETVRLVPQEAEPLLARVVPPARAVESRPVAAAEVPPPPAPDVEGAGVALSVPPAPLAEAFEGPDELPLSYSGSVEGVEVMVRGGPVSVSELRGARTLIIRSEGLWVRIRIPGVIPRGSAGAGGSP